MDQAEPVTHLAPDTVDGLLLQVQSVAERRGWTAAAAAAAEALDARTARTALASPADVESGPLLEWLAARHNDANPAEVREVRPQLLDALGADALGIALAERVVVVFECGRLLTATDVDAVAALFARPPQSYAIVFVHSERIAHEDDLEFIERNAWRLLVPDAVGEWNNQDLLAHRIVLWSAAPGMAPSFLADRLRRDADVLAAWWTTPLPADVVHVLACRQTLAVLDIAEKQALDDARAEAAQAPVHSRIADVREDLRALRGAMSRRIETDIAAVERQLVYSLQVLETDLLAGVMPYLEQRITGADADSLKQAVTSYVQTGADRWSLSADKVLREGGQRVAADIDTLFTPIDWTVVNAVAARAGIDQAYPDVLSQKLQATMPVANLTAPGSLPQSLQQIKGSGPSGIIGGVVVGSLVTTAAAFLLFTGPISLVVAGVLGATGGSLVGQRAQRESMVRMAAPHVQLAINEVIRQAIARVHADARRAVSVLHEHVYSDLNELVDLLDANYRQNAGAGAADLSSADHVFLDDVRQRVQALAALY